MHSIKQVSIFKLKRALFYISSIFIAFAELIDLILSRHSAFIIISNPIMAFLMLVIIFLYAFKVIKVDLANGIVAYTIFAEMLISPHLFWGIEYTEALYFRTFIVIMAIIPYISISIGAKHGIIIGILSFINFILIVILYKNPFLQKGFFTLSIVFFAYNLGIYFLTTRLIKSIKVLETNMSRKIRINKALKDQKLKLKQANDSKNRLVSIISHDLKNPFNTILGFLQLMESDLEEKQYDRLKTHHEFLHHSANQTYFLLQNMLEWARNEQETIQFTPTTFNVEDRIYQTTSLLLHELKRKNITFTKEITKDLSIFADEMMFESIVRNLITNAIKFTPKNGAIHLSCHETEYATMFYVKDNGIGMSQENINSLFVKKTLKSREGTDNETGTGLGLRICKDFIDYHKGQIWVKRNKSEGVTFYFSLPKQKCFQIPKAI